MTSRLAQWEQQAKAARAESAKTSLVSKKSGATTSTSRILQDGQMVAVRSQVALPTSLNFPLPTISSSSTSLPVPPQDDGQVPSQPLSDLPPVWGQFEQEKDHLANLLFHQHSDVAYGKACACGREGAVAIVKCSDCWHALPTCEDCFVTSHLCMPTHWAELWSQDRRFTTRCDISSLPSQPHIQLGHGGKPCPNSFPDGLRHEFLIVDTNGVHSTRLRFCTCCGADSAVAQLMKAKLFPATFVKPKTAFTFAVLKQYHIHHLESAESAYSFVAALRRLTDTFFFNDASDPYDQFRDVFKMWMILTAEKRYGHQHNINSILVDRPPGHLAVGCPACPEQNVNTDRKVQWPAELR